MLTTYETYSTDGIKSFEWDDRSCRRIVGSIVTDTETGEKGFETIAVVIFPAWLTQEKMDAICDAMTEFMDDTTMEDRLETLRAVNEVARKGRAYAD